MIRLLAFLLFLPTVGLAQTYPEPLSDTVSDFADLLPPEAEARVTDLLQAAREETGVHITLATIASQAEYGGSGRFADFATGWFNAWGIGDATRNDGILILVGRDDREMRIVLGDAYDVIWDGRAQRVIDSAMLPAFREGDYAGGLEAGAQSAIDRLARPYSAGEDVTETSGFPEENSFWTDTLPFLLFAIFAALIAFGRRIAAAVRRRLRRCPDCGHRGMHEHEEVTESPGDSTEGHGIRHQVCTSCQSDHPVRYVIPSLASQRAARKSSSSGFGGGRSSGGGASGRW